MSVSGNGLQGLRAGVPVLLGYVPVAMAYGIAARGVGLSFWETLLISVFVYAGAAQFFILAAIKLGTPVTGIVAMVSLLNARHLLYGPLIGKWLPESLHRRLGAAFLLTDEVFATAFHAMGKQPTDGRFAWYMGLGLTAWLSWIGGTAIGLVAGSGLTAQFPQVDQTLRFALVALFFSLALLSVKRPMLLALLVSSVVTLVCLIYAGATAAIVAGTVSAWLCYVPRDEKGAVEEKAEKATASERVMHPGRSMDQNRAVRPDRTMDQKRVMHPGRSINQKTVKYPEKTIDQKTAMHLDKTTDQKSGAGSGEATARGHSSSSALASGGDQHGAD